MTTPEVNHIKTAGYNPNDYYNRNPALRRAIDLLLSGLDGQQFPDIANSLRYNDPYMVLADFASYSDIQQEASRRYRDAIGWQRMSLMNIAASGFFCADRSIHDYSREIWNLRK